jgi:hypothetical protein
MKKRIALFGLLATLAGSASAQTTVRITGSTAFRASVHVGIQNILQPGYTYAYAGTNFTGASQAIFTGTTKAPTSASVIIKTSWSGSVGGTKTVVQNLTVPTWLVNSTAQSTTGTPSAPSTYDSPVIADITMSDQFQNSTEFRTPVMVDKVVGVIPFQWVRNFGAPITITNMTPLLAGNLLSGGILLSQFTGNPADNGTVVYAVGRDEDSGTRLVTYAESFFGIFSSPTQYQAVMPAGTITDLVVWPPSTVLGTNYPLGHSGYPSGGTLVAALNAPGSNNPANPNPGWLVGYAGVNDAGNVVPGVPATATANLTGGAVTSVTVTNGGTMYGNPTVTFSGGGATTQATGTATVVNGVITAINVTSGGTGYTSAPTIAIRAGAALKWNGFDYSPTAVREGQYTFWSYEHLNYRTGYANSAIADQLALQIHNVDAATAGILLSTMNVGRPVEGGDVTPGNPFP